MGDIRGKIVKHSKKGVEGWVTIMPPTERFAMLTLDTREMIEKYINLLRASPNIYVPYSYLEMEDEND